MSRRIVKSARGVVPRSTSTSSTFTENVLSHGSPSGQLWYSTITRSHEVEPAGGFGTTMDLVRSPAVNDQRSSGMATTLVTALPATGTSGPSTWGTARTGAAKAGDAGTSAVRAAARDRANVSLLGAIGPSQGKRAARGI